MGSSHATHIVFTKGHFHYNLEQQGGGYGLMLDKQKGEIKAGFFYREKHHGPVLNGLLYFKRNQAKQQTYAGVYFDTKMSSGKLYYSGESQTPDLYCGSHNQFSRHGFGEYSESNTWKYIGFWNNETMDGVGRYTNKLTNESFMGVFSDNSFQGWGSYQRVKQNKILKHKSSGKQFKGTEYVQICSYFELQNMERAPSGAKMIQTGNGSSVYEAFPRLEEVFFKAGHSTQYVIQLFTEYKGELVNIRRMGKNVYHVLSLKPRKLLKALKREDVINLADYNTFEKECKPLIQGSMDPDFQFNDIDFTVLKVQALSGLKCRYLVSCDFEDEEQVMRYSQNLRGSKRCTFIAKGYIVANENEVNIRRHELKMLKIAEQKKLAPALCICHYDPLKPDVLLRYSSMRNLHSNQTKPEQFPKKYIILSEELRTGEFLEAILGFKPMTRHKVLSPVERMILVKKIINAYSALENLGIYHGQVYPCHIYVKGLHTELPEDWEAIFVDFSEAVYVEGNDYESRFECAVTSEFEEKRIKRDPYERFYVHKMYSCPKDMRMFQHPLFRYYARNHLEIPVRRLFFDIRHTDLYSLVLILLILLAPSLQTEDLIKKKLEQHSDECFENYALNKGKIIHKATTAYGEKKKITIVEDIITKTYSMNDEIQENIDELVHELINTLQLCTPDLRSHNGNSNKNNTSSFTHLKFALKHNIDALIDYFSENKFKMRPGREKIFNEEESEDFHRTIANRLLGALDVSHSIEEKEDQMKHYTIFDRFFGTEWNGQEQEDEKEEEIALEQKKEESSDDEQGINFLNIKENPKKRRKSSNYFDSVNGENIALSVTTAERSEHKREFRIKSEHEIEEQELPEPVKIRKQLSRKDLLMMEGISKQRVRNHHLKKRGPIFPWKTYDKYGTIIFEENMKNSSDSSINSVLQDCESE